VSLSQAPTPPDPLPTGLCAQAACLMEATARKPGNVHRFRDFDDATLMDYLLSAAAIGPVMAGAAGQRVGATVLDAVRATRRVSRTNTNLGIILLLAPLAAVPPGEDLRAGVERVLTRLDRMDARLAYQAIREANPGGLGEAPEQDVKEEPTQSLREVMALIADWDLVARQYANGFREVFDDGVPVLSASLARGAWLETAIVGCHLHLMAKFPDALIVRKRGQAEAEEAAARARRVLQAGWPETDAGRAALGELDAWLRAEGRGRNPGTTADLVTACLFVALRERIIQLPQEFSAPQTANGPAHD
jgi:triphosphoribosyl-dephospho-CoA synthase